MGRVVGDQIHQDASAFRLPLLVAARCNHGLEELRKLISVTALIIDARDERALDEHAPPPHVGLRDERLAQSVAQLASCRSRGGHEQLAELIVGRVERPCQTRGRCALTADDFDAVCVVAVVDASFATAADVVSVVGCYEAAVVVVVVAAAFAAAWAVDVVDAADASVVASSPSLLLMMDVVVASRLWVALLLLLLRWMFLLLLLLRRLASPTALLLWSSWRRRRCWKCCLCCC